ncbi:GNAT family N-acetyltransferase [Pedococcus bigeumensis]|uniref:GNAT family N-acetyltransferase n=1 Tax=Pedococcus bigeumensis TaxID=433644 RepID=A0A502CZW8_9MICO|nr:GNAT family N-acetyltransferase [Pedococcus bigeumensis]TPG18172.1 GNAT family N-acetyltransferase [Pedococcus bigeumensis]
MLRPATDSDRDALLAWRNHPHVRAVSLTGHVITPEEHAAWWATTASDPARHLYIYERGGVAAGVVMFAGPDHARAAMWSFYLDVAGLEARGELLPAWIEAPRQAVRHAFDELGLTVLTGEVLGHNAVVRQMNRRLGFRETAMDLRDVDGVPTEVVTVELRNEERRDRQRAGATTRKG